MAHNIETMAYANAKPWHGLGTEVADTLTPAQMQKAAQLDWTVSKRPAYTLDKPEWSTENGQIVGDVGLLQASGHHFIVRDSDNSVLSQCGEKYIPIQNKDIFDFFVKFTQAGHMKMETAGSLRDGKEIWGLAKLKDDFELAGGDEVKGYLLINQPHEAGKAMTIKFTPIRVVCNNTLTMALRGEGTALRMPHVKEFDEDVRAAAEEALGLSSQAITDFKEKSEFLASRQYKQESVLNYIAELYQPSVLVDKAKALTDDEFVMQEQFNATATQVLQNIDLSPGATMKSAKGTWWGALNGVTYHEDHQKKQSAPGNALHSSWFGVGANRKAKALDKAIEYANAQLGRLCPVDSGHSHFIYDITVPFAPL